MNLPTYRKTSRLLFYTDLLGTRFTLAIAELLWALTLFWPGNTFDRPTYFIMANMAQEHSWAIIFLLSGVTQMTIAITANIDSWFAKLFAGWNAALWVVTVLSMYFSVTPPPAAVSGEAALALASIWIWIRPFVIERGRAHGRKHASYITE